ncbi:hypothetical protein COE58_09820 [Bacillus cereus]|uniref:hypothetical protein n=1 Tax=Bacillus cereus group TaxID=86661 RepID=UPI0001A032E7|nr:hypothetical protein [Bacillus cereus]EEK79987.1 hypothetical protein bcere0009_9940 [Bacillus cereus R309803]PGZ62036.1 hypothetical protein COE58_09820 [Bacillus cereus]HDR4560511.1 hypothetical protein [Bacillus luti]
MNFIEEIRKIENQIANTTGDLANQVIDELQAAKKQLERQMERVMLKTEVDLKALDIIKEDTLTLQKNIREFHVLQTSIRNIASKLEGSFESKTGTVIQEVLKKYEKETSHNLLDKYIHLSNSCGKR